RLVEALAAAFAAADVAQWEARLAGKDVCVTPVNRLAEAAPFMERLRAPGDAHGL
ncbi:MAG: hypothetical protein FD126_1748, partial [Elusimicrobia bacterium]